MKTSLENVISRLCNFFAIIPICLTWKMLANYPGTCIEQHQTKEEEKKFALMRSRSPENLKFGHFALLFCQGRERNVPKCKTHVQSDYFCSLIPLFCGVLVAVAVVVAQVPYLRSRGIHDHEYIHKAKIKVGVCFLKPYIMNV